MTALAWLIPAALCLGGLGLAGFLWSLRSHQYDDLDGAAWRALDDEPIAPYPLEIGDVKTRAVRTAAACPLEHFQTEVGSGSVVIAEQCSRLSG